MKKQNIAPYRTSQQAPSAAVPAMATISATVLLAAITHAYAFGPRAVIAGLLIVAVLCGLNVLYQRTRNTAVLVLYGIITAWVIIGFGVVNGFWNHAFKAFLYYLHNGALPPLLAKLFMTPRIESPLLEGAGILTFAMSVFAAYYGYKFIKEVR